MSKRDGTSRIRFSNFLIAQLIFPFIKRAVEGISIYTPIATNIPMCTHRLYNGIKVYRYFSRLDNVYKDLEGM